MARCIELGVTTEGDTLEEALAMLRPRVQRLSSKEMIKLLESSGFVVVHTRGSHCKLRKEDRVVIVPHDGRHAAVPVRPADGAGPV